MSIDKPRQHRERAALGVQVPTPRNFRAVAVPGKFFAHKVAHQPLVLLKRELVRQGDVQIQRKLRIAALFNALDLVDQALQVVGPGGRIFRRIDGFGQQTALAPVVPHLAGALGAGIFGGMFESESARDDLAAGIIGAGLF